MAAPPDKPATEADARARRQAAALRENLRRRKAQTRARDAAPAASAAGDTAEKRETE